MRKTKFWFGIVKICGIMYQPKKILCPRPIKNLKKGVKKYLVYSPLNLHSSEYTPSYGWTEILTSFSVFDNLLVRAKNRQSIKDTVIKINKIQKVRYFELIVKYPKSKFYRTS